MELKPQLIHQLRGLRMSGVLETLEARERQAIDGQWSYLEFLSRLLEDETERRAQKQLVQRVRRSADVILRGASYRAQSRVRLIEEVAVTPN
jgi:hypothetical protein